MKWLILMLIISCGKHQEPNALDIGDNDGDLIQNHLESGPDQNIADFEGLGEIRGVMRFNDSKVKEVSFANHTNLEHEIFKLIVGGQSEYQSSDYFSEWTRLVFEENMIISDNKTNIIHLEFETSKSNPDELVFKRGDLQRSLGSFRSSMQINLSQTDFNDLMKGHAHLGVLKKFPEETIKSRTFRTFIFDGERSRILYVSKKLTLEKLLQELQITGTETLSDNEIFFHPINENSTKWYQRTLANGDQVLVFSSVQKLKMAFKNKLQSGQTLLKRDNGHAVNSMELRNIEGSRIYLKIRPSKTLRTFTESSQRILHTVGSRARENDFWYCTYFKRSLATSTQVTPAFDEIIRLLKLDSLMMQFAEQNDEKGMYWEIMIENAPANLRLGLPESLPSTFTITGQYHVDCSRPMESTPSYQTNIEGELLLNVESWVEKLP